MLKRDHSLRSLPPASDAGGGYSSGKSSTIPTGLHNRSKIIAEFDSEFRPITHVDYTLGRILTERKRRRATEQMVDLKDRGGRLMISRRILPRRTSSR